MKKLLSLFVALIATTAIWAQNNVITYIATKDLSNDYMLTVGKTTFGPAIKSHTYSNGTGKITCSGEITKIGGSAFSGYLGLTSVTIPNSVTTIGESAFKNCTGLTSVTIPDSVTTIGEWAFAGCIGLTSVTIPNSVTEIGGFAFNGCSGLTSVTIPNSVTTIGEWAFAGCIGLTSVTIPNSVTTIGEWAFASCIGLTSVTIGNSVTTIGDYVFYNCNGLTSVTIGNSVTTIGRSAFEGCIGLTSITIPNSVTTIGDYAFYNCNGLTSVNVDAANTHYCAVDGVLFNYAKDTLIQYPIGNPRTTYTIPISVTTIGNKAFENCSGLTSVTIPNSVTTIGSYAFNQVNNIVYSGTAIGSPWGAKCVNGHVDGYLVYSDATKIKLCGCSTAATGAITIPNSVTEIGDYAFYHCSGLTSVAIPNSVTTIGESAFKNCTGLTSVTIPNSVTMINAWTFYYCSGLTSVTIGNSVIAIGWNAFSDCRGLNSITCYAVAPPTVNSSSWCTNVDKSLPIYVPAQSVDAYKLAFSRDDLTNILPIGAEQVITEDTSTATPMAQDVTITWPQTDNADTYTLEIRKNGELVCTLTFDANGVLTNITFAAPARGGERTASTAELTVNGYKFTVTGLETNTEYTYAVIAKDASAQPIQTYSGSFKTTEPTGLEDLTIDKKVGNKFIYGNQLYIRRGDKIYNAAGGLMK